MKAVIFLLFDDEEDNYIEDIQRKIKHDVNRFMITNVVNPHKLIYNKIENIFCFKDVTTCLKNVPIILRYLEMFNYTEVLLLNVNKTYSESELVYKDISSVKNEFAIIQNVL
jgi:hypothetical protein